MIDVSIYASAIRTERWLIMYEDIKSKNTVNFEFVFAGPNQPTYTLPDNFKFFKTSMKPCQCYEIAARNCQGLSLVNVADDVEYTKGAIDLMFEAYLKDPKHIMATCDYHIDGVDKSTMQNFQGNLNDPDWPYLPVCGLHDRELYNELGGADRRFTGVMHELDVYMRLSEHGVKTVRVNGICNELVIPSEQFQRSCSRYFDNDRPKILAIWEKMAGVV